ncbi:amidohydrolase [Calidifontibacter sp. DB0510]|uniref:Amidohydrolase n=2 Tax=Metallococcus carri TaxID=1656884 RepID=A0A967EAT9_9MICO|nr:amidohydrolase [Metallococcus carri]NOP38694.1 amidohydrolase [Calidifontibacter sp. DB2511S]
MTTVSGLLVDDGLIVAAGAAADLEAPGVRVHDLPGELVIPGLHDAHIHTAAFARDLAGVNLRGVRSVQEAQDVLRLHQTGLTDAEWVLGGFWDSNRWEVPVQPGRADLDAVTGDRPAVLWSVDCHTLWVNSAALRAAGITGATDDPPGGEIVRDAHGQPTGILRENACAAIESVIPSDADTLADKLRVAQDSLLRLGLTSITDIDGEDALEAFRQLYDARGLAVRVTKAVRQPALDLAIAQGRRTGDGDDRLRTGPVKLFSDGALGSHTSHMSSPFAGEGDNCGLATLSPEELYDLTRRAVDAGLSVATHAIGDAAAAAVLDAYERVLAETGTSLRLRIEHAQHLRPADIPRMARLGVVASMQPTHCTSDLDLVDWLLAGHDIVSYGWRTVLDAGVPLAFGSDAPVESPNPFLALHAAVTRQRADGIPPGGWQPHERVTLAEALSAHTLGAAYAAGDEARKGTLEPGKLADFIAVDTDLFAVAETDPVAIAQATVQETIIGGESVFTA